MKRDIGREAAEEVRSQHELGSYVDVERIAAQQQWLSVDDLPSALTPCLYDGRLAICPDLTKSHRRWAIAHALGHIHLHKEVRLWFCGLHTHVTRKQEREADSFAWHLLVSAEKLRALQAHGCPPEDMAEAFGVPLTKVREYSPSHVGSFFGGALRRARTPIGITASGILVAVLVIDSPWSPQSKTVIAGEVQTKIEQSRAAIPDEQSLVQWLQNLTPEQRDSVVQSLSEAFAGYRKDHPLPKKAPSTTLAKPKANEPLCCEPKAPVKSAHNSQSETEREQNTSATHESSH